MQFLNRKNIEIPPHKIISDAKSDASRFLRGLLITHHFSPRDIADLCALFVNLDPSSNRDIDGVAFVTAAQMALESDRIADAADFCLILADKNFSANGGWEVCSQVAERVESCSVKRTLISFAVDHCRADKIGSFLSDLDDLDDTESDLMINLPDPGETLKMLSAGVKRLSSNTDEDAASTEPAFKRLRDFDYDLDQDRIDEILQEKFHLATRNLEDPQNFATAISCLLTSANPYSLIDSLEKSEENLLLICSFLSGGTQESFCFSTTERVSKPPKKKMRFDAFHRQLLNLIRGDSLVDLGVDSEQFLNDENYRRDTIFGMADTDDPEQLRLALDLAAQYNIDTFELHSSFMENTLLTRGVKCILIHWIYSLN